MSITKNLQEVNSATNNDVQEKSLKSGNRIRNAIAAAVIGLGTLSGIAGLNHFSEPAPTTATEAMQRIEHSDQSLSYKGDINGPDHTMTIVDKNDPQKIATLTYNTDSHVAMTASREGVRGNAYLRTDRGANVHERVIDVHFSEAAQKDHKFVDASLSRANAESFSLESSVRVDKGTPGIAGFVVCGTDRDGYNPNQTQGSVVTYHPVTERSHKALDKVGYASSVFVPAGSDEFTISYDVDDGDGPGKTVNIDGLATPSAIDSVYADKTPGHNPEVDPSHDKDVKHSPYTHEDSYFVLN